MVIRTDENNVDEDIVLSDDMYIRRIADGKKLYLDLLLLADEQESMIDRYLERGEMYVLSVSGGKQVAGLAVVTDEGGGVCELKNIAVSPVFQRRGYGRKLLDFLCRHYGKRFHTMKVGTGDSVQTTGFYRSCGFGYSYTVEGFFTDNYDRPIVEEGKVLKDMLYFIRSLQ